ncbi:hypothetical protein Mal64_12640 [Pseudobythopirellula maris]|uniref:Uncharacterized protein n=1 Tax=Pseudobythopirellula maris TaxID=2527991 RepID=A0A5C5ZUI0_9BACT|nr:hypothetical protein Mal64_12640 [Pseudobythopirellula maris]
MAFERLTALLLAEPVRATDDVVDGLGRFDLGFGRGAGGRLDRLDVVLLAALGGGRRGRERGKQNGGAGNEPRTTGKRASHAIGSGVESD